jgi:hypothetical protein
VIIPQASGSVPTFSAFSGEKRMPSVGIRFLIILNGTLAFELFEKHYANLGLPYEKLPSTSPANPRFSQEHWRRALDDVFRAN